MLDGSNLVYVTVTQELGNVRDTAVKRLNISARIKQLEVGTLSTRPCRKSSWPPWQQRQEAGVGWCRAPGKA